MSRIIKLRAYRKDKKIMDYHLPSLTLPNSTDGEHRQVAYQEFTGLLDNKGKEVYEGDYIKRGNGEIGIIKFKGCSFVYESIKKKNGYCPTLKIYADDEIIGNLYENPELLNHA